MTIDELQQTEESKEFDEEFLHNFGDADPIPIGATALCGAVSKSKRCGETEPLRTECCPICLSLTPHTLI